MPIMIVKVDGATLTLLFFLTLHLMMPNVTVTEPRAEMAAIKSRSSSRLGIAAGTVFGSVHVVATWLDAIHPPTY